VEINKKLSVKAQEDFELIKLALDHNDQNAYARLLEKYRDMLFQTMFRLVRNKEDAEDLVMEAFGKVFNKLHTYNSAYAFSTWLFRIATNNGIDFMRKKNLTILSLNNKLPSGQEAEFVDLVSGKTASPEERLIRSEKRDNLKLVIGKLRDKYKKTVEMRFFEEKSYEEIASELAIPLGTVKAQIFRAKELLLEIMKNKDDWA
jgi:RNA polymerase sigma factor (sigma-70 family)